LTEVIVERSIASGSREGAGVEFEGGDLAVTVVEMEERKVRYGAGFVAGADVRGI
jgi:hypothetical protein